MDPLLRRLLMGSTAVLAPPNDQGGGGGDPPENDLDEDDLPEDDLDGDDLGDEGDDQGGEDEDDQGDEPPPRRAPTRGENRVQTALRRAEEAERRVREADERIAALERNTRQPPRESAEAFQARLAAMDPVERLETLRNLDRQEFGQALQNLTFTTQDAADQVQFDALCARNPTAAKLKDEVDRRLADLRKQGQNAPRANILKFVLGERALSKEPRARGRAERDAAARRDRQSARPGSGRSDAAPDNRRDQTSRSARDKRLEDIPI
jgi:hypothetical protein